MGFALAALLVVPIVLVALRLSEQERKRVDDAWKEAAEKLKGEFLPVSKERASKARQLDVSVRGVHIIVDHYTAVTSGKHSNVVTRFRAAVRAPEGFQLRVFPSSLFSGVARLVGVQDVPVGHELFDENYIVKSNAPELAPLWLNKAVRKRIKATVDLEFELRNGSLEVRHVGLLSIPSELVSAVQAVASFANGHRKLLSIWRDIAKVLDGKLVTPQHELVEIQLERDGLPIQVGLLRRGERYYTFASAAVTGSKLVPFVLTAEPHLYASPLPKTDKHYNRGDYTLWANDPRVIEPRLDGLVAALEPLNISKLRVDEQQVRLLWPGIETQRKTIRAAVARVREIASHSGEAAYR